jgi:hypothetical protein
LTSAAAAIAAGVAVVLQSLAVGREEERFQPTALRDLMRLGEERTAVAESDCPAEERTPYVTNLEVIRAALSWT